MRRGHFEALRPVCPLCRSLLAVGTVIHEAAEDVLEGIVVCTNAACSREYPVVDGIPVFVAAIRSWLSANPLQMLLRDDLSPEVSTLLGDAQGPESPFDTIRQHVGIYAADYEEDAPPLIARALALAPARGPAIDIGCAAGRGTFALAEATGDLTVGIDLNFAMLRVAARVLRSGRVRYDRRRVGLVYERREFDFHSPARDRVDFWCCDAAALPFADDTFTLAVAMNIVDCVPSPGDVVAELARVASTALLATPYDWAPTATPLEHWLGGHSQRGPHQGASEPVLRMLLAQVGMQVTAEEEAEWRVRVHERSMMQYAVHMVAARRAGIA